jgi:threonyl-tRNA synthetase
MNGKIRDFANQKTPYILVFGDKEDPRSLTNPICRARALQKIEAIVRQT